MKMSSNRRSSEIMLLLRLFLLFLIILPSLFLLKEKKIIAMQIPYPNEKEIVFVDGINRYVYSLQELGLVRLGQNEGTGSGKVLIGCKNHQVLSYKLFLLSKKIYQPAKDASFFVNENRELKIIPEQEGRELDLGLLITELGNPGYYQEEYILPIKKVQPQVTAEQLEKRNPRHLWAEYSTILADIPDRTENVRIASAMLNGLIISPHEEISFNSIVGPREINRGYRAAMIISAGKFEPGVGGGICQVSSTLYNTLLLAGLDITERHNHSVRIYYVPLGRDATVVYGSKDLKFVNNTGEYLLLRTSLDKLTLTMSVYGPATPPAKRSIKLYTKIIREIPPAQRIIIDESLPAGEQQIVEQGQPGYLTETHREYAGLNESVDEIISTDYYQPIQRVIRSGPPLSEQP